MAASVFALIPNSEPLAAVLWLLQFINYCDGVVFHGDSTITAGVRNQIVLAETEFPGPLAGFEEPCRGKIAPIRFAYTEILEDLLMRLCDRHVRFRKIAACKNRHARRNE